MPEVYSKLLQVVPPEAGYIEPLFLELLKNWIGTRWASGEEWFLPGESSTVASQDGSIFRWEPFTSQDSFLYEFTWRHPHGSDQNITWATQVSLYKDGDGARLSVRVWNTGPDHGEEGLLLTTRPKFLASLPDFLNVRHLDGSMLSVGSRRVDEEGFPYFVRYELLESRRIHPVLLISPAGDGSYPMAPDALAAEFITLAEVVHAESPKSTFSLTHELDGARLSCYNGAVRVYLPGFTKEADPLRHPLLLPRQIKDRKSRVRLAQYLARLSVRYYEPDDAIPKLRDLRALHDDQRRRAQLNHAYSAASKAGDAETWQMLAEEYSLENEKLRNEGDSLREQLRIAQQNVRALSQSLRDLNRPIAGPDASEADMEFEPETVLEAVEHAESMFGDYLRVLPSAYSSAEASPYRRPGQILAALKALADIASARRQGPLGRNLRDVFTERGLDYRAGITDNTPPRLRQQYEFSDEGNSYTCEEHICFGTSYDPADCARIYFSSRLEGEGRLIIGHVGRHFEVQSTT